MAKTAGKGLVSTPPGVLLPFGCMDVVIEECGKTQEYQVRVCVYVCQGDLLSRSGLWVNCVMCLSLIV